ncbi:hypothetical protein NXC12_CH01885 [Rhizobium etli]|uniref:Uncharacterized protein n=1 Tax=Rhizobium etli TaxID=29449 RepID=A0AAN1EJL5_RHIET|nr:hypothetical protein NXC12_CH01885 [Rhizobium etli]
MNDCLLTENTSRRAAGVVAGGAGAEPLVFMLCAGERASARVASRPRPGIYAARSALLP